MLVGSEEVDLRKTMDVLDWLINNQRIFWAIENHLKRLGCDCTAIGPVASLVVRLNLEGTATIHDDHASATGDAAEILARLEKLPDLAGLAEVWNQLIDLPD